MFTLVMNIVISFVGVVVSGSFPDIPYIAKSVPTRKLTLLFRKKEVLWNLKCLMHTKSYAKIYL